MARIVQFYPIGHASVRIRKQRFGKRTLIMLWTLAVVFLVLWAMGFVAFHVTTGLIHLLLLAAVVVVVVQLVTGRRTI
jgi:hypothetical protein